MIRFLKKRGFLLFCFLAAAGYLLICSKSSPLYPMNDWVDVNCFYTMGKSMLEGLVPYRDLYEQKGPVLYFIYALVALFSPGSYFGVYSLEVLTFGLFLYYSGKTARLYLGDSPMVWFLCAILGGLITSSRAFAHGASVEEMGLFMSAYGLYVTLKAIKERRTLTFREALVCGLWCGILLWVKYTMLGLYLGIAVFILLWYLFWEKDGKALLRTIGAFFAGVGAVTLAVLVYFLAVGALGDLFTVYFYNNIFLYPQAAETSRLAVILGCVAGTLKANRGYTLLFIPGLLWAGANLRRDARPLLLLVLSFLGLALGTYWGGWNISYYGLVFAVFAVFGLTAVFRLLQWLGLGRLLAPAGRLVAEIWAVSAVLLMMILCLNTSGNTYLLNRSKEEMPQYRFAEIIRQTEDATLLNFGYLDGGFYYAADVTPSCRFFCILNVNAPDMWATQYAQVREGLVDYVVTRDHPLESYRVDASLYECVDQAQLYFEGRMRTYYLYRLISLGDAGSAAVGS